MNKKQARPPWWQDKLVEGGYRLTPGRRAVLDVLSKASGYLSAEDIYMKIHVKYPRIGLTTIYRTLDVSSNLGIVSKFDFGDGQARYEMAKGPAGSHHHHHLVCTSCKRIINYTDFIDKELELLRETEKRLSENYDFKIIDHVVKFCGLCGPCRASGAEGVNKTRPKERESAVNE